MTGAVFGTSVGTANLSLELNTVGAYQLYKQCNAPVQVVAGMVLQGKNITIWQAFGLITIFVGAFPVAYSQLNVKRGGAEEAGIYFSCSSQHYGTDV